LFDDDPPPPQHFDNSPHHSSSPPSSHHSHSSDSTSNNVSTSRKTKRGTFDHKNVWDGTIAKFKQAEAALQGYVYGAGMAYIIKPHFLQYLKQNRGALVAIHGSYKDPEGNTLSDLGISLVQLQNDDEAIMYGATTAMCRGQYAQVIVLQHASTTSGVLAYIDLIEKYRPPKTVHTDVATDAINTHYHEHYNGGLQQYLIDFEEAYTKLDEVTRIRARQINTTPVFVPEMNQLDHLYSRLQQVSGLLSFVRHTKMLRMNFHDTMTYLRQEALTVSYGYACQAVLRSGRRRANLLEVGEDTNIGMMPHENESEGTFYYNSQEPNMIKQPIQQNSNDCEMFMLFNQAVPEQYMLPREICQSIPREARGDFLELEQNSNSKGSYDGNSNQSNRNHGRSYNPNQSNGNNFSNQPSRNSRNPDRSNTDINTNQNMARQNSTRMKTQESLQNSNVIPKQCTSRANLANTDDEFTIPSTEEIDPNDVADDNQLNVECQIQDVNDEDQIMVDEVDRVAYLGETNPKEQVTETNKDNSDNLMNADQTNNNDIVMDEHNEVFDPGGVEMDDNYNPNQSITLHMDYFVFSSDSEIARFLYNLYYDTLIGRDREFDTLAYTLQLTRNYSMSIQKKNEDLNQSMGEIQSGIQDIFDDDATVPTSNTIQLDRQEEPSNQYLGSGSNSNNAIPTPPDPGELTHIPSNQVPGIKPPPDPDPDGIHTPNSDWKRADGLVPPRQSHIPVIDDIPANSMNEDLDFFDTIR